MQHVLYILLTATGLLLSTARGCRAQSSPTIYDLEHPEVISLPHKVNQVSGIVHQPGAFVYAIDDDHGSIYKITLNRPPEVKEWSFGKKDDYEDLALVNGTFYVLASTGRLAVIPGKFPLTGAGYFSLHLKGRNELESLYYDPQEQKLVLLCKECAGDKKDENSAWAFDPQEKAFDKKPLYRLKRKDIEKKLGQDIGRFKPSAAALHPQTGELYIISSINKLLVVLDRKREVSRVYPLDARLFKQPEGMAFTPGGDLLITNEAAGKGPANILVFKKP